MQNNPQGAAEVTAQPLKGPGIRPGTPKCEITYDFDPKGE